MYSTQITRVAAELASRWRSAPKEQRRPLPGIHWLTSMRRRLRLKDEVPGAYLSNDAAGFSLIPIRVTNGRRR